LEAREQGLTRHIGITGHGNDSPTIFMDALRRFDFDSILFPINFVQYANAEYRRGATELLQECRRRDVGTMIIKPIGKGVWRDKPRTATTWYEPFEDREHIQAGVNFPLSQDVTGICTAGDVALLPLLLEACERFTPLDGQAQDQLIATAGQYESVFAEQGT
jgi:predicted aldo/keto reductase-like oxidoreductase